MTAMPALRTDIRRCRRKRTFLSRQVAANAAWLLRAALIGPPLEPFRCGVCGDWHLQMKRGA